MTAGETLLLAHFTPETLTHLLPWVYISIALVTILISWAYENFIEKLPRIQLIIGGFIFFALVLILFRWAIALKNAPSWIYYALLVWFEACSMFAITLFFSYTGDYFSTSAARRLYGYITTGMAVGAVIAGFIVVTITDRIGVENLLYICILLLLVSASLAFLISKTGTPQIHEPISDKKENTATLKTIFSTPYLIIIFLAIALTAFSSIIADYQMLIVAKTSLNEIELIR